MSVVGWIRGGHRVAAMGGVVISTLVILVLYGGMSLLILCR